MVSRQNSITARQGSFLTRLPLLACFALALCMYGFIFFAAVHQSSFPTLVYKSEQLTSRRMLMQRGTHGNSKLLLVQAYVSRGASTPRFHSDFPTLQWRNCPDYSYDFPGLISTQAGNHSGAALNNISESALPGGCRSGVLTSAGYQASYDIGTHLRSQYIYHHHLLPQEYQPSRLQATSSPQKANIDSLQGVLSGLFPLIDSVVPVTVVNSSVVTAVDGSTLTAPACPALHNLFSRVQQQQQPQSSPGLSGAHNRQLQKLIPAVNKLLSQLSTAISNIAAAAVLPGLPAAVAHSRSPPEAGSQSSPTASNGAGSPSSGSLSSTTEGTARRTASGAGGVARQGSAQPGSSMQSNADLAVDGVTQGIVNNTMGTTSSLGSPSRSQLMATSLVSAADSNGHITRALKSRQEFASASTTSADAAQHQNWHALWEEVSCIAARRDSPDEEPIAKVAEQIRDLLQPWVVKNKLAVLAPGADESVLGPGGCERTLQLSIGAEVHSILQQMQAVVAAANVTGGGSADGKEALGPGGQAPATAANRTDSGITGLQMQFNRTAEAAQERPLWNVSTQEQSLQQQTNKDTDTASTRQQQQTHGRAPLQQVQQQQLPRMYINSVEDTAILLLLRALDIDGSHWPRFSSHLEFELWQHAVQDHNLFFVRVLYQGQPILFNKVGSQVRAALPSVGGGASSAATPGLFTRFSSSLGGSAGLSVIALDDLQALLGPLLLSPEESAAGCGMSVEGNIQP